MLALQMLTWDTVQSANGLNRKVFTPLQAVDAGTVVVQSCRGFQRARAHVTYCSTAPLLTYFSVKPEPEELQSYITKV